MWGPLEQDQVIAVRAMCDFEPGNRAEDGDINRVVILRRDPFLQCILEER